MCPKKYFAKNLEIFKPINLLFIAANSTETTVKSAKLYFWETVLLCDLICSWENTKWKPRLSAQLLSHSNSEIKKKYIYSSYERYESFRPLAPPPAPV